MNVVDSLLHFGVTRRDNPALIEGERALTFGELADRVRGAAKRLSELGLRPGDRIGLCLKDTPDHVVALLGAAFMGAVATPLDWRARGHENARFIDALKLACVLVEPDAKLPVPCPVIALDDAWRAAVAQGDLARPSQGQWSDPFAISATSGSTGQPKFTVMTHTQFYFAVAGMWELMGLAGPHRFLGTMPLYYSGGRNSCLAHLLRGDAVIFYPSLFGPEEYVEVVKRHGVTVGGLPPSAIRQLLKAGLPEPAFPELTMLFSTGAPLFAEEKRAASRRLTPRFHERYGAAETLAISILRPSDFADRADSVGQPHSLAEITIVDERDHILPTGAAGRLRYRGPGLAAPVPGLAGGENFRDGYFYPGEIARLDAAGYIFIEGRSSDVIMRGGAKIYPAEVEAVLLEHPAVLEAAVVGVRREDGEESAVAFVASRAAVSIGELLAYCRGRLTAHKVPRDIHLIDALPKNTAGKTDKLALRKSLEP